MPFIDTLYFRMTAIERQNAAEQDDGLLVRKILRGSGRAFHELYKRHARYIAGVVYRILGEDGDLDDIVQETFISAVRGLEGLRDPDQLRLWLVTIAVRQTQQTLRRRRRQRLLRLDFANTEPLYDNPDGDPRLSEIYDALDHLSEKIRIPWMLHIVEGMTIKEVSRACSSSPMTVKRRLASARTKLRGRIDAD